MENNTYNKDDLIKFLSRNGHDLKELPDEFRSDVDIVKAAISDCPSAFQYSTRTARNNKDLALFAVSQSGNNITFLSDEQRCDKDIVLAAVKENPHALMFASPFLKSDLDIVKAAIRGNVFAIQWADWKIKSRRDIALECVKKNGLVLQILSHVRKNHQDKGSNFSLDTDKEIVMAALNQNPDSAKYVNKHLAKDKDVAIRILLTGIWELDVIPDFLLSDRELVKAAVIGKPTNLHFLPKDSPFLSDKEIVMLAVTRNGNSLFYASDSLKSDPFVVLAAVKESPNAYNLASPEIKKICEGNDPILAIESYILANQLHDELKNELTKSKKIKI